MGLSQASLYPSELAPVTIVRMDTGQIAMRTWEYVGVYPRGLSACERVGVKTCLSFPDAQSLPVVHRPDPAVMRRNYLPTRLRRLAGQYGDTRHSLDAWSVLG